MKRALVSLCVVLAMVGCKRKSEVDFPKLTEEFVYRTVAFSPAGATGAGLHEYQGVNLDNALDDAGSATLQKQREFYESFRNRLTTLDTSTLSGQDKADLGLMEDQIALALLDLNEVQSYRHNPTTYVETLGNALFNPYMLEYAPAPQRFRAIVARLGQVPRFLEQATLNLISAPPIWTQVAMEENEGNLELVDKTLRAAAPAEVKADYDRAAGVALTSMRKFQEFLEKKLSKQASADWRLGKDRYQRKFRLVLEAGVDAAGTLSEAESDLTRVRARMLDLALPLHRQMFPAHTEHAELAGEERINRVVGEVLGKIAERHSTPQSYVDDARADLEEARAFVRAKGLLTMPTRDNLKVIPTPGFLRGIYSVGGFNAAPAFEPQLGAFYWITPIPENWPKSRAESKLREYNFYKLKLLTIHEAVPGHYVQLEVANGVEPKPRRLLRSAYGNGPYIEGWAQYATQTMLDQGFLGNPPELALTFAKEELRVIANAILDIRLQSMGMTDQEALDLMEKRTFQEKEEAEGKLRRAKLSSCQLPTYFVGWRGWLRVRGEYQKAKGQAYTLAGFHDAALRQGSVPLETLSRLLK